MFSTIVRSSSKQLFHTSAKRQNLVSDLYVQQLKAVKLPKPDLSAAPVKEFKPEAIISALQTGVAKDAIIADAETLKQYNDLEPTFAAKAEDANDWYFKNELNAEKQGDWLGLEFGFEALKQDAKLGEKWVEENKAKYTKWE
ncbi:hypothetical protein QEN19_000481 [Hanseniaspora menglaensis]